MQGNIRIDMAMGVSLLYCLVTTVLFVIASLLIYIYNVDSQRTVV